MQRTLGKSRRLSSPLLDIPHILLQEGGPDPTLARLATPAAIVFLMFVLKQVLGILKTFPLTVHKQVTTDILIDLNQPRSQIQSLLQLVLDSIPQIDVLLDVLLIRITLESHVHIALQGLGCLLVVLPPLH